jgi:nickel transport protein
MEPPAGRFAADNADVSTRHGRWRSRRGSWRLLGLLLLVCIAGPVLAHKLNLFAAAEGRRISGEVYFAGGGKAADVPVLVQNAAGETLAELRSGADGRFVFEAEAPVAHRIVAETPDGHRAAWRIGAVELAGAFPAAGDTGAAGALAAAAGDATKARAEPARAQQNAATGAGRPLDPAVAAAIERAVARQVRPLRDDARAAREAAQFRDVLGGIGYILGLAGLGLWWRCRCSQAGR